MTAHLPGEVGTVVYYADKQQLVPARVAVREGSRYVLENLLGERFAVVASRLFWAGRAFLGETAAISPYWEAVRTRATELDLSALWERLEGALPPGPTAAEHLRRHAARPGEDEALVEDAIAVAIFADTTCFRVKDRVVSRETAAAVAETRRKRAERDAARQELELATAAFKARIEGHHVEDSARAAFQRYREALIEVAALGREAPRWAFAQPLCEALGVHPDHSFELLVRAGELSADANLAPLKANVPLAFDEEALTEARKLTQHRPAPSLDLTHLEALAIDDPDTTEVDDAVAISKGRLYVLIADGGGFIQPGSLLDREAARRTSTLYLPEGKVPMLPPELGEGPLSLNPGEVRSALAFSFGIAADGQLEGLEVARARVRIAQRLTYEETDRLLTSGREEPLGRVLATVEEAMDRHRAWRNARGAVTFQRPEVYYVLEPDGRVRMKVGDPLGPARQLIAELMVATCTAAAVFCAERQIPCIYRAQAAPDDPPVGRSDQRAKGAVKGGEAAARAVNPSSRIVDDVALQHDLLRRLKPSTLQITPAAHWTLAVPAYSQVTSPIRRYADLLMHQQLTSYLKLGRPALSAARLEGQLVELARRQLLTRRVEQESRRFYALRWLAQNPQTVLTGTVLREVGRKTLVELAPVAIHELINMKKRRAPGTVLTFEVISVDPRKDEVQLKELG